jgi:hypothetical protein
MSSQLYGEIRAAKAHKKQVAATLRQTPTRDVPACDWTWTGRQQQAPFYQFAGGSSQGDALAARRARSVALHGAGRAERCRDSRWRVAQLAITAGRTHASRRSISRSSIEAMQAGSAHVEHVHR